MIGSVAGNGSLAGALKACHSACLLEFMDFSCKGHTRQAYPCHGARSPVGPDAQRILATI
jgi:hypothetical protein